MSRTATKWAYKKMPTELGLTPPALALLRAICWAARPENDNTDELSDEKLMRLTGYKTHQKIIDARILLNERDLVKHFPQDEIRASPRKTKYKYHVRMDEMED